MLLIDDPELLRDRGYIDGAWAAGRLRRHLPRARSGERRGARRGAAHGRRRDAARDRGRRRRAARLARAPGARARGDPARLLGPDAPPPARPGHDPDARAGQAAGRVGRRDRLRGLVPRVVRRGGQARLRRHDPGAADGHAHRRAQAARRRLRRHHALELPLGDDHAQGRAGAGRGQHDRLQAGRADAALGARAGRARRPRGRARGRVPDRHGRCRGRARLSAAS